MPIIVRAGDDFLRSLSETQVGIWERADDAALRKQRHSPQLSLVLRGQLHVEWTRTGKAFPSSQSSVYIANNRKLRFNRSFLWSRHLELRECACQSHGKWLRKRRRGATGAAQTRTAVAVGDGSGAGSGGRTVCRNRTEETAAYRDCL